MTIRRFAVALLCLAVLAGCEEAAKRQAGGRDAKQEPDAISRSSSAGMPEGNVAAGEKLAQAKGQATGQSCIDCHGAEGNAPIDATYPKLGGQFADYLAYTLTGYRDGRREHALMSQQAKGLSDQQIADLAAYFASRPSQIRDLEGAHND